MITNNTNNHVVLHNKGINYWSQLAIFLGLLAAGLLIGGIISIGILIGMADIDITKLTNQAELLRPENAKALQVVQLATTFFVMFLPAYFFAKICYRNQNDFLGLKAPFTLKQAAFVALILLASYPVMGLLAELNKHFPVTAAFKASAEKAEAEYAKQVEIIAPIKTTGQYLLSLIVIALMPAVFEELLFRGGIQQFLTQWWKSPWLAILITSLIFSAIHVSWYGFFVRAGLGAVLGYIFYKTGSIWLSVLLHFLNNAIAATAMFVSNKAGKPVSANNIEENFPWWLGIIALAFLLVLLQKFGTLKPKTSYSVQVHSNNPFENYQYNSVSNPTITNNNDIA
jgi:uncharacterized protein